MIWQGWTEENMTVMRKMAADKKTALEIAKAIGAPSRSAVLGRAHRSGIKLTGRGNADDIIRRTEERRKAAEARLARENARRDRREAMEREGFERIAIGGHVKLHTIKIEVPEHVECSPRPWLSRVFGECAFPIDGEGADTRSCCNPVKVGSYCEGHRAVVSTPMKSAPKNIGWFKFTSGEYRSSVPKDVTNELEFAA